MSMGVGRIFSGEGPILDFPEIAKKVFAGGVEQGKISYLPPKTKKATIFVKNLMEKCQTSKSRGVLAPLPPSDALNGSSIYVSGTRAR